MSNFDEASILALATEPIAGAAATGIDAADDENYILVLSELNRIGRIEGDPPNWFNIVQGATNVLQRKSKDVEMAAAMGYALFKLHGYTGLAGALKLLTDLCTNFWDGLFPERPRRRKARIESLTEAMVEGGWFKESPPKPNEFDAVDSCVARIGELTTVITEKMADDPPDFSKCTRALKELAAKRPKPAEAAAPAASASPAGGGGGGEPLPPVGEPANTNAAESQILTICTYIRKAEPTNPLPYAIVRLTKWAMMSLPTSDDAKYQIPPPEATVIDAAQHQAANGMWDYLLNSAESAFRTQDPLWLDLQRYSCMAMAGLGPQYENARQSIMTITGGLVRKLGSGLFELRFRSGTPLCGGDTKMWIESEVASAGSGGGGGGGAGQSNGKLTEASDTARKLAGSGKLKEAVAALQEGLSVCTQRRDRFLWRLRIAQLCFDAQRIQLALPLLEECCEDVKRHRIDEWEPSVAVEAAQTLYRCRKAHAVLMKDPAPELVPGVRESFAWLCQLDPSAALAVEPSGK
ncbi:MAG: type VI secretion system protein TssA [Planctomycetes bacterium]|nr:type VI secretion system protein TssA [Planctomycetota bacterium]